MKNYFSLLLLLSFSIIFSQENSPEPVFNDFQDLLKLRDFTLNSETREAYFTLQSMDEKISVLVSTKKVNDQWSEREILDFSGTFKDLEPFLSPDGLKLYFASNRPLSDSNNLPKDYDIWYVERENLNSPWSSPINLGSPVNSNADEFYPSVSSSGNLYFTRPNPENKSQDDIFFSKKTGTAYAEPEVLGDAVNTAGYEFNSYIAADESFLIFSGYNREDGLGSGDLYISYKTGEGGWSQAKNLGETVNSDQMDYCPYVDMASKTLYFTSRRASLKQTEFQNYEQLLNIINSYENGLSRIYKIDFSNYLNQSK